VLSNQRKINEISTVSFKFLLRHLTSSVWNIW